jgi:uncharacterized membrane protein
MKLKQLIPLTLGIGAIAGLRSMAAPAIISRAARRKSFRIRDSRLKFLQSNKAGIVLSALAVGELVADKLPFTPNRTSPAPLAGRIASGSLCGAVLASAAKRSVALGALFGGIGALAGSFAGHRLRRRISRKLPPLSIAAAEDALTYTGGLAIASLV